MNSFLCFYFQVHQPFRLKKDFSFFDIGTKKITQYEDEKENREIMEKIAQNSYLPMNKLIKKLIDKTQGKFKVSFSISGMALEQFSLYAPCVLESFKELSRSPSVEFLAETYYHSLSSVFSPSEFTFQVKKHQEMIEKVFFKTPSTFRNTELIYNDDIASLVRDLGFKTILAQGHDKLLLGRNPNFLYEALESGGPKLLLKNLEFSDDIAFRFSNKGWSEYPLTPQKYLLWLKNATRMKKAELINLFMDYETFGEHQSKESGIFKFFEELILDISSKGEFIFSTPQELSWLLSSKGILQTKEYTSWADSEKDLSAWNGNSMQQAANEFLYSLEGKTKNLCDHKAIEVWRKLQTSDHVYYMSTKGENDGDVHNYFRPYPSAHDAFIVYTNILNDFKNYIEDL